MSWEALAWVGRVTTGSPTLKSILWCVASHHNKETRYAYPSVQTIADETELDPRTVRQGLAKLVNAGYLRDTGKKAGRTGQVTVYTMPLVDAQPAEIGKPDKNARLNESSEPAPPQPDDLTSESGAPGGDGSKDSQKRQSSTVPRGTSLTVLHAKPDSFASATLTKTSPNLLKRSWNKPFPKPLPRSVEEKDANLVRLHDELPPAGSKLPAGSVRREHVWFWQQMRGRFGQAWYNNHGAEPTPTWIEMLDRFNRSGDYSELQALLDRLKVEHKENFPPSLDRCEQLLQKVTAKLSPYSESERRDFWNSFVISQAVNFATSLELVKYGAGWRDLPTAVRADVVSRIPDLVDTAIAAEKQSPPLSHASITTNLESDLMRLLRDYTRMTPDRRAAEDRALNG